MRPRVHLPAMSRAPVLGVDPWADKFCCQVESLYGRVDPNALRELSAEWARRCFAAGERPEVQCFVAVGDGFDVLPLTDSVLRNLERGDLALTDGGFRESAIADFARRSVLPNDSSHGGFAADTVQMIVGARHVRLVYGHVLGDETVMFPKSRRLLLAISGRISPLPPPLVDRRSLTGARVLGAAAQVALRRPRAAGASVRTVFRERARLRSAASLSRRPADPDALFTVFVTLETVTAPKIPSVLFYCSILRDLNIPPAVVNHVIADVRSYSPILSGTGGNAVSAVPFTADWSVDTPKYVAADIAARLRAAEPAVRLTAARMLGLRAAANLTSGASVDAATSAPLVTSMSYYRVPAGQAVSREDGGPVDVMGLQTPELGVLAFNARDFGGRAVLGVSHRGGLVDREAVLAALVVSAARVGCRVTWSWSRAFHTADCEPVSSTGSTVTA